MENRVTCAVMSSSDAGKKAVGTMCTFCSTAKFEPRNPEPYWVCKKYGVRLNNNDENLLVRCEDCMRDN